jgi:hypothetical protein
MSKSFVGGHALIMGMGSEEDLPTTVDDALGLAEILKDPGRCAYPADQVELLTGEDANRAGMLSGLEKLANRADEKSTVVIYFSGHGYQVKSTIGDFYYLMPFGYNIERLKDTAISGTEFAEKIKAIKAQKMLLLLDCCHAGGMAELKAPGLQFAKAPLPPEAQSLLAQGRGRVVIASSTAEEVSWGGKPYSAFTLALIEAFCGLGASEQDGFVRAADLAMYAREKVPGRTKGTQHPILHFQEADNFILAYYSGGEAEPKGLPFDQEPEIEPEPGAWSRARVFDQRGQIVHGPQTNITGNVQGPVFSGQFSGPVAMGGEAVDMRGSTGAIYKPSGSVSQHIGDRIKIIGDGNVIGNRSRSTVIRQKVSMEDFLQQLKALKQDLEGAGLDPEIAREVNGNLDVVDYQAHKEQPNRIILMNRLKSSVEMLDAVNGASGAIEKVQVLAATLLATAGQLFR